MIAIAKRMKGIDPFHVMRLLSRAKELEHEGRQIIHMEIGEPDFPAPQAVIEACTRVVSSGSVKYTATAGLPRLRQAIADYYNTRYGVTLSAQRILVTPGASGALLLAFGTLINSKDQVIMADPGYPCNRNFVRMYGGAVISVPVDGSTNYQLTAELVERNWGPYTRGVLIASPSNPTGTLITPHNLRAIADFTRERNGFVVSDEIYHGLEYDAKTTSLAEFSDQAFVVNSFSKYFGMTGWRVGWLVVPGSFIGAAERLAQNIFISAPSHSQHAALASFGESNIIELENRCGEFKSRRDFLYSELASLGFDLSTKPQGAFYLYANCKHFNIQSSRFAELLLEIAGVAVTPGKDFGTHNPESYLRFAYTTSMDSLAKGVERIANFIKKY